MALNDADEAVLRGQVKKLETDLATVTEKSKKVDELTGQVGTLTGQLQSATRTFEAERAGWAEERAALATGIDPEGLAVARVLHGQLPEQGRPPLPDWLKSQKADLSKAHRGLVPFFQAPAGAPPAGAPPAGGGGAPPPGGGAPPAGTPPAAPPTMGAARPSPPAAGAGVGGDLTLEAAKLRLTELSQDGARTGDWKTYDAERPALLARIARG